MTKDEQRDLEIEVTFGDYVILVLEDHENFINDFVDSESAFEETNEDEHPYDIAEAAHFNGFCAGENFMYRKVEESEAMYAASVDIISELRNEIKELRSLLASNKDIK